MTEEIKRYKGHYTGPQIDDLLGRVPAVEQRVSALEVIRTEFVYSTPSRRWECNHRLGKKPSVTVVDDSGNVVFADIRHIDDNSIVVVFGMNATGRIILN